MDKGIYKKIGITIICIIVNVIGRVWSESWHFPIWLDTMGTCLAVYYAGAVWGITAGVAGNLVLGIFDPVVWVYAITNVAVALAFNFCVKRNYIEKFLTVLVLSFWIGILCVVVSTPLNMILYDGYTGNIWGDALYDMLQWYKMPAVICAIAAEFIVEVVDKQICLSIVFVIIHFIFKKQPNRGKSFITVSVVLGIFMTLLSPAAEVHAETQEVADSYIRTIYNNRTGMMSSEANVIEETEDGCIWIGSYAGLTRYDGKEFTFIKEGGIVNVTSLFTDSQDRLWIGTNDSGIARYEDGKFTYFKREDGLSSNTIYSFTEASDRSVYVGTSGRICKFDEQDNITIQDWSIIGAKTMLYGGKDLYCVDSTGNVHCIVDGELSSSLLVAKTGIYCNTILLTTRGLIAGTDKDCIYKINRTSTGMQYRRENWESIPDIQHMELGNISRIWVCTEDTLGYISWYGEYHELHYEGFDHSFEWIHEDYQGNIWVASSRYGVMKISETQFTNVFSNAGIEETVVNAVARYQGTLYCAADDGLVAENLATQQKINNDLTRLLEGDRTRCLMVDSKKRLWVCTYGDEGLVRWDGGNQIDIFNMETKKTTSNKFRCIIEQKDGTIVAGTANGINFIKDDEVVEVLTAEDGMNNTQILALVEAEDGTIYACSDGAGIYVIRNQKIVEHITMEDGLTSDIILRMVPYNGGYFVVTSNALCYMKDGKITELSEFPYYNNYNIQIMGEEAYVLSSAGIYIVKAKDLVDGEEIGYRLINPQEGLLSALTPNSWNYIDDEGSLYLCANSGVVKIPKDWDVNTEEIKFGMMSVDWNGQELRSQDDVYYIPAEANRLTFTASVKSYILSDVKVRFFIRGIDENPEVVSFQALEPIQISNLPHGSYTICIQIMNSDEDVILQEKVYRIEKEAQMWENGWYGIYLAAVIIEAIALITGSILLMLNVNRRKRELEVLREELEYTVKEQTKEIRSQKNKTENTFLGTVLALSEAVDAKDRYTSGHSKRVADYSKMIAARMGKSKEEQLHIYFAGLLHDIGKIRIPEYVINKPGKLTKEEFEFIKVHPVTGYYILKGITEDPKLAIGAKFHHERYDGKGYPNGLIGDNIPEIARIIGVADAYDAMASNRSYRTALPQDVVRQEIVDGKGKQFDPIIADVMLQLIDEDVEYTMKQTEELKRNILVVDDEKMNIDMVEFILQDEPLYRVLSATSGAEALKKVEQEDVDLVFLDFEMPEMNGFETLKRIREFSNVPVVFMTSNKELKTIQQANEMGIEDYLTKPFLPLALMEVLHSILR